MMAACWSAWKSADICRGLGHMLLTASLVLFVLLWWFFASGNFVFGDAFWKFLTCFMS